MKYQVCLCYIGGLGNPTSTSQQRAIYMTLPPPHNPAVDRWICSECLLTPFKCQQRDTSAPQATFPVYFLLFSLSNQCLSLRPQSKVSVWGLTGVLHFLGFVFLKINLCVHSSLFRPSLHSVWWWQRQAMDIPRQRPAEKQFPDWETHTAHWGNHEH